MCACAVVCVCVSVCVCVCDRVGVLCVLEGEEGGSGGGGDGGSGCVLCVLIPSAVSFRTAETEQLSGGANDWRDRARVVCDLFSN